MSIIDKCELIKESIKNKDLPRMVTIDGSWGCGKTTFVKKHLMTHMEDMNPVYLSLTGVTDIAVFKDRLLSAIYFNNEKGANALENLLDASMNFFDKATRSLDNGATSSTVTTLIKSLRGAAKDSIIRKIENTVIIIDDLERIHCSKLQRDIMGECLNLTLDEDKNVGFIFPINMSEITLDKRQIEKYISLRYVIEHDIDSYFDYAFKEYTSLINFKPIIINCIEDVKISNIRVMKRIASKLNQVVISLDDIENDQDIDIYAILSGLFKEAFIIADNHFNKGLSAHKIKLNSDYSHRDEDIYISGLSSASEGFIDFICNRQLEFSVDDIGYIPTKSHGFDDFLFKKPYQFNECFDESLKSLEEFIKTTEKSKPIIIWFKLLDTYIELVRGSYTFDNIGIDDNEKKLKLIARQEFNGDYFSNPNRLRIKDEFLKAEYEKKLEQFNNEMAVKHQLDLFEQAKVSWIDVDREIYNNYEKRALFVGENIHVFINLLSGWDSKNTGDFTDFVKARYKDQIRKESKEEALGIKTIISHLVKLQKKDTKPSLAFGTRQELISAMEIAIKTIEEKLKSSGS
ncbi:P-loop NTPase fold protein [Vibrio parahaemolyticus]|uniref:P-loop NTPase fold protein n=1 Tax=Vibrio parahaemolyticus TaxID=670 RepID=UPI00111D6CE5|nr:P-loop NTPase fold protein [Vibrio parahaemolyticus]EHK4782654.1 hypothetical protein [Vibrio parahaemolyticus]EJK2404475.1 hypothetical protein [Vibrio parahaemolyticus]EKD9040418.1 hypothetical protein [Vibrio parahaemolyticus]EME0147219.1 hypothetical protein [Vibrio parahaemolyticus]TNZ11461.1 hypothetical protein CGK55_03895 [Vibrio parahaemolyticus]